MVYNLRTWDRATSFAEWLYQKRRAAKLSQEELATAAGCTKGYVSQLERATDNTRTGKPARPSEERVEAFARALGIRVAEAFLAAGYAPPTEIAPIHSRTVPGPIRTDANGQTEISEDLLDDYDRWYFAFEGESGFSKLSPSERDAFIRRAMAESKRHPITDFRRAVEDAQRKDN